MKTIMQAFFCSLFIHIVYFFSTYGWAYIKTKFDKPDILGGYVATSHTDVMFVFVGSPVVFLGTSFFGIAIVCGFIIILTKKYFKIMGCFN
ncbi:hypothetical protein [Lysinibacillus sphaericus]|uniref:hypothetical protein n=1 Tax=Lysinibacillus sphaericus TaxID=1421 RepID=UPI003CFC4464